MGLPPPTIPEVSGKLRWFRSLFNEVAVDRDYVPVGNTVVERRLTASVIAPYYELLGVEDVMPKDTFFGIIRAVDRAWMTALQQHKAGKAPTK